MKFKLLATAALFASTIGMANATVAISSAGGDLKAWVDNAGNFDNTAPGMLQYKGKEYIKWGVESSWYWFDESGNSHVANFGSNPLGGTTYAVGPGAAATTIASAGWTFSQVIHAVAENKLAVTLNLTNNTGADATKAAWTIGFDPDQGQPSNGPKTRNTVLDVGAKSSVSAWAGGYGVTLQNDTSAAAFSIFPYINMGDCCTPVNPHTAIAANQTIGTSSFADDSINLAYDLGNIKAGQTVSIGYSYVMAVPEPQTYALMLAGLGAIGWLSARRRRS
ncbi:PEP-CTERM sorting domain-containing protein [Paucibacter sp. TC2R-5]|uniref:PEP-CTERM sorting domain-containing protein n=1 Tax=Paucibacter sp. TC2R-5 TaxID=2893555 RepID=UPI0021E4B0BC|nr:PEP-CTERM sorting domain-containing protein [Paucibacter sp. TC2R-5]MCV2358182.1 PEP-CTERM sorting domain-containing protein [Paucibacter sp. TC2R-5]